MRTLFVAEDLPWPENNGYRIRLGNVVRALAEAGPVHVVGVATGGSAANGRPSDLEDVQAEVVRIGPQRPAPSRLWRWARSGLPRRLVAHDYSPLRTAVADVVGSSPFDLTWVAHAQTYVATSDLLDGPLVVDLDNLADAAIRHRRARAAGGTGGAGRLRTSVARRLDVIDERRWSRLHARIAARAEAVLVCSEIDRVRLGTENAVVVPNGATIPERLPTPTHEPTHPVVTMVGLLAYEANADAAGFFVEEILPILRASCPSVELRLVGRTGPVVNTIAGTPNVTIVGEVPDVTTELALADLVAVPIRFGGGTRLKVLEAFAQRVPVVSTAVGIEGIEAVPGRDLLVADEPAAFAEACRSVIERPELRRRLTDAAFELVSARYRWESIREEVVHLATSCADVGAPGREPGGGGS